MSERISKTYRYNHKGVMGEADEYIGAVHSPMCTTQTRGSIFTTFKKDIKNIQILSQEKVSPYLYSINRHIAC